MKHTFWANAERVPANFRGPGGYLGLQETYKYQEIYEAARKVDKLGLLDKLTDDDAFGAITRTMPDGKVVTRDLLDSVLEINWIQRYAGSPLSILDVGSGYGRMAHRMDDAFGNRTSVTCVDAIERSRLDCRIYLSHRRLCNFIFDMKDMGTYADWDMATAIHSFSEMSAEWVRTWLARLATVHVHMLLVIPNDDTWYTSEENGRNDGELWRLLEGAAKLVAHDKRWPIPSHRYEDGGAREYTLWEMR